MFSPTTRLFFKILLSETLQHNKLWIPKKFVRVYGNTLSNQVVLKLPCGSEWKIGLKKCDGGEMWFENGWDKFVEFYSLKHGSMVVFRYNGNSEFEAFIFDTSSVEIDYPTKTTGPKSPLEKPKDQKKCQGSKRKRVEEVDNSDDEIEIVEDSSAWEKAKEMSLEEIRKTSPIVNTDQASESRANKRTLERPMRKIASESSESQSKDKAVTRRPYSSPTNPYFKVVLKPSYVSGSLNIPKDFSASNYIKLKNQTMILQVGERRWRVSLCVYGSNCKIIRGWSKFVREQSLSVGDICEFELIKTNGVVMKVIAHRGKNLLEY